MQNILYFIGGSLFCLLLGNFTDFSNAVSEDKFSVVFLGVFLIVAWFLFMVIADKHGKE